MSKAIDSYISDLHSLLKDRLPSERIEPILREADAHLRESVKARMADEELATQSAIKEYGHPKKVALSIIQGAKPTLWGCDPGWWSLFGAVVVILCWNFHWLSLSGPFDNFGEIWQSVLAGFIGCVGAAIMVVAARCGVQRYGKRLLQAGALVAVLALPILSAWVIPSPLHFVGLSRLHLNRDLPKLERGLKVGAGYQAFLARAQTSYARANQPADLPLDLRDPVLTAQELTITRPEADYDGQTENRGGNFIVPRSLGAFIDFDGRGPVIATTTTFPVAKKAWSENGSDICRQVAFEMKNLQALYVNAVRAEHGRLFFFDRELYSEVFCWTVILLPVLYLLSFLGYLTGLPRRRSRVVAR